MLDFDFAGLDARALDVAASLKSIMHGWENPTPLEGARMFCRGYRQWIALTAAEIEALPWLMRLRDVASTKLRIGRALVAGNIARSLARIEAQQATVQWLQEHGQRFIDVVGQASR
jgi:Ser/Thr protein kinase RdoA (MazF antagonist)